MEPKRAAAALLMLFLATAAFAQSASTEFGRMSGGAIELMTKHSRPFSGSLALTTSRSQLSFGSGGATLGGTLVPDRIWFFASAEKSEPTFASQYGVDQAISRTTDAKMIAQLGDRQNLAASFAAVRQSGVTTGPILTAPIPSSFLSLHYTGIVSNNMFFTASFSELKRSNLGN